jgi:hypothetical protein
MKDLIEALQILGKYQKETRWPTHCEHDVLYVGGIDEGAIPSDEVARLDDLGFHWDDSIECWSSYRFGSA